jgi:hypothetical protein
VNGTWTYFNYATASLINQPISGSTSATAIFEGPVWAFGSFVSLTGTLTASDSRLKNIIGQSDSRRDLDLLRQIDVTDFTYIDQVNMGSDVHKKVVAQQVEKVLPAAVKQTSNFLPDIYATAGKVDLVDGRYVIAVPNPHHLKDGDKVRLIVENGPELYAKVKPIDACTFSISSETPINSKVFVYGREHSDVRCVDYEAISVLNVSATQQLAKQIEALEKENSELKAEATKRTALDEQQRATTSALEAKVAKLEAADEALARVAAKVAALEQAVTECQEKERDQRPGVAVNQ